VIAAVRPRQPGHRREEKGKALRNTQKSGYGQDCPVARTLDIVGERWTFLILRDLLREGPRKFQDFEVSLAGAGPNTLSARLKRLEEAGIVERRFYDRHPPRAEYVLTGKGRDLGPVLLALKKWGETYKDNR
jgi:DNA-binding HxlR family transcriptional regulator